MNNIVFSFINRSQGRIKILFLAIWGELIKLCVDLQIIRPKGVAITGDKDGPKLIVSLTSYGRRVHKVYYTIVSLLRQKMKPDMVILWLDFNWNEHNIPSSLKRLSKYGLTIRYCSDLKSYKKLVPTLLEFPDAMIITCDDDLYYRSNMVGRLVDSFKSDPTKIYAHRAHQVTFTDGNIDSYNSWPEEISNQRGRTVFPTSGGGTLYKKELLHVDMCNEELFMRLSPMADDVWNFFMGYMKQTINVVLPHNGYIYIPLDVFYQAIHKGSNLSYGNCHECMNDVQIKAIMEHYHLSVKDLQD